MPSIIILKSFLPQFVETPNSDVETSGEIIMRKLYCVISIRSMIAVAASIFVLHTHKSIISCNSRMATLEDLFRSRDVTFTTSSDQLLVGLARQRQQSCVYSTCCHFDNPSILHTRKWTGTPLFACSARRVTRLSAWIIRKHLHRLHHLFPTRRRP